MKGTGGCGFYLTRFFLLSGDAGRKNWKSPVQNLHGETHNPLLLHSVNLTVFSGTRDSLKGEENYGAKSLADARSQSSKTRCRNSFQDGFGWRGWEMDGAVGSALVGAGQRGAGGRGLWISWKCIPAGILRRERMLCPLNEGFL